jgi:hypothetical protein
MIALYLAIHLVIYLFVHAQKKVDGKIKTSLFATGNVRVHEKNVVLNGIPSRDG